MSRSRTAWQIWAWPLAFGALIVLGLLSALLGQGGAWWAVCWIALAAPLIAIVRFALRAGSTKHGVVGENN